MDPQMIFHRVHVGTVNDKEPATTSLKNIAHATINLPIIHFELIQGTFLFASHNIILRKIGFLVCYDMGSVVIFCVVNMNFHVMQFKGCCIIPANTGALFFQSPCLQNLFFV